MWSMSPQSWCSGCGDGGGGGGSHLPDVCERWWWQGLITISVGCGDVGWLCSVISNQILCYWTVFKDKRWHTPGCRSISVVSGWLFWKMEIKGVSPITFMHVPVSTDRSVLQLRQHLINSVSGELTWCIKVPLHVCTSLHIPNRNQSLLSDCSLQNIWQKVDCALRPRPKSLTRDFLSKELTS